MRRKILFGTLAVLALFVIFIVSRLSFIEINITDSSGQKVAYELLNQKDQKSKKAESISGKLKKLVWKGTWEVTARSSEKSYFGIIKTGGFLRTSEVVVSLENESKRQFIGMNPGSCMLYTGNVLISHSCSDTFINTKVHIPATSKQPTYVKTPPLPIGGNIEGIVKTGEGLLALIRSPYAVVSEDGESHNIYKLSENLTSTKSVSLTELDADKSYYISRYREGFIAYDTNFESIYYYPSINATPQIIEPGRPTDSDFGPLQVSTYSDSVVATYSNSIVGGDHDKKVDPVAEVFISSNGRESKHFVFEKSYSSSQLCADDKLCLLSDQKLEVYEISGKKPKLLYVITGVQSFASTASGLYIVRDSGVFKFDVGQKAGFMQYSFGDYEYCGIQTTEGGYVLCLINNRGQKVALYIDDSIKNTDSIDKKVAELSKLPEISNISVYDKYIYIVPNLGPSVYDKSKKIFTYDSKVKKVVNDKVNQQIGIIGFDQANYSLINIYR